MTSRWISFIAMLPIFSPLQVAWAQRTGAIEGTFDACMKDVARWTKSTKGWSRRSKSLYALKRATALHSCATKPGATTSVLLEALRAYDAAGFRERAIRVGHQLLKLKPAPELRLMLAKLLVSESRDSEAVKLLELSVKERPDWVDASALLGSILYRMGETKRAVVHLKRAAEVKTEDFGLHAALGDACLAINDLPCAAKALARASSLNSENILLATKVGDLQRSLGRQADAITAYKRALEARPEHFSANLGMSISCDALNLVHESAWHATVAARQNGDSRMAKAILGRALRRLGFTQEAFRKLSEVDAKKNQPGSVAIATEYIQTLISLGKAEDVSAFVSSLPNAIAADPSVVAATGDSQMALARLERALVTYQKLVSDDGRAVPYMKERLLLVFARTGRVRPFLKTAASLPPNRRHEGVDAARILIREILTKDGLKPALALIPRILASGLESPGVREDYTVLALMSKDQTGVSSSELTPFLAALSAFQSGSWREAVTILDGVDSARAHLLLSYAYARLGEPEKASAAISSHPEFRELQRYFDVAKNDAEIRAGAGAQDSQLKELREMATEKLSRHVDRLRLLNVIQTKKDFDPPQTEADAGPFESYATAVLLARASRNAKALRALKGLPNNEVVERLRTFLISRSALEAYRRGEISKSRKFVAGLSATPSPEAAFNLALLKASSPEEVLVATQNFSTILPSRPELYLNRALAFEKKGDQYSSLQELEKSRPDSGGDNDTYKKIERLKAIKAAILRD